MSRTVITVPSGLDTYTSAIGLLPASGVRDASCPSGPWMVEEQRMDFTYARVPAYYASATQNSLFGPSVSMAVAQTVLAIYVTASYSKRKVYDWFCTSSFQQTQKFEYNQLEFDKYGINYKTRCEY